MLNNFAVFIMVHGRPERMWTAKSLRKSGYTGKIYYVADDLDDTLEGYKEKYGDDLLVFSKEEVGKDMDAGDKSGDLRSTLYAANTIPKLAKEKGLKYFMISCDDYTRYDYRFGEELFYTFNEVKSLDKVFKVIIDFLEESGASTVALAQGGDFIGGQQSNWAKELTLHRKAMNTFFCSVDRPFKFIGRLNEDVTTYVNLGSRGYLFFTIPNVSITQRPSQSEKGGLTHVYLATGTYVKSFFSVMYNPSCVIVSEMGDKFKRIHHHVKWANAVPCILEERYKK